jgi:hypothetical protein
VSGTLRNIAFWFFNNYFVVLFIVFVPLTFSRVNDNPRGVIWSDAEGYYKYLPSIFIIKDFHKVPQGSIWPYYNQNGEILIKYTCGVAILEAPFFLVSLMIQKLMNSDYENIFNINYAFSVAIAGLFYGFLGLYVLKKHLLKYFSSRAVFLTIISILFGTNFFHYLTKENGMSHVYSFFLFSVFIYNSDRYYKKQTFLNASILGLILGLITLIRPTSIIVVLIFFLWNISSIASFIERLFFLLLKWKHMLTLAICFVIMFIPQFLYWYEMTGQWIYYSYQDEGFIYWKSPKILSVLFDTQNGLFIYSPIAFLLFCGLFKSRGIYNSQFISTLFILIVSTYLFSSWWAWWFGGAFGHRSYVEFFCILSLPYCSWVNQFISNSTKTKIYLLRSTIFILAAYSVRVSYLYTSSGFPWDGEDWRWNMDKFIWILTHLFKL